MLTAAMTIMTTTMMAAAMVEIARDFLSRPNFITFSSKSLKVLKRAHAGSSV
jgi:hypothetical protein